MKRDLLYLDHTLGCIAQIRSFTAGGEAAFRESALIQAAVLRTLQTLAESLKRISPELRGLAPEIPWAEITGLRNVLVHEYLKVDLGFIWQIVVEDLPPLEAQISVLRNRILDRNG